MDRERRHDGPAVLPTSPFPKRTTGLGFVELTGILGWPSANLQTCMFAATIAAGLDGVRNKMQCPKAAKAEAVKEKLPYTFQEGWKAFKVCW